MTAPEPGRLAVQSPSERHERYATAAAAQDQALDRKLSGIRRWQDNGDITPAEAADLRVAVMSPHLRAMRLLRVAIWGDDIMTTS